MYSSVASKSQDEVGELKYQGVQPGTHFFKQFTPGFRQITEEGVHSGDSFGIERASVHDVYSPGSYNSSVKSPISSEGRHFL